jgi:hypothetical protein
MVEFEVVWNGTMDREGTAKISLVPDRPTKMTDFWVAPHRIYNKKSEFWKLPRKKDKVDKAKAPVETEVQEDTDAVVLHDSDGG